MDLEELDEFEDNLDEDGSGLHITRRIELDKVKSKVEFITGVAGSGKTYLVRSRILQNPNYAKLTATTGIAAVNLQGSGKDEGSKVTTINSTLGFFDTKDMAEKFIGRKLQKRLLMLSGAGYENLALDEVSMLNANKLDILYNAIEEVNQLKSVGDRGGMGLVISGDFLQLPPVVDKNEFGNVVVGSDKRAYHALCWKRFEEEGSFTKLERIWRQDNLEFIKGLNYARCGDGKNCAELLKGLPEVEWRNGQDVNFEGTTIVATNKEVDRINLYHLQRHLKKGDKLVRFNASRWGKQLGEWKNIPEMLEVTENSYVMVLSNDCPEFTYVNGNCGWIAESEKWEKELDLGCENARKGEEKARAIHVKLVGVSGGNGNSRVVCINPITRYMFLSDHPDNQTSAPEFKGKKEWKEWKQGLVKEGKCCKPDSWSMEYENYLQELTNVAIKKRNSKEEPFFNYVEGKWCVGGIRYVPLRLAYGCTVHKTQGLTLDRVQIDPQHRFFGSSSMLYVALSRVSGPEGLRIVGSAKLIEERCNLVKELVRWI
jgi:hypothetical protein